jgi:hypothetical protein
LVFDFPSRSSCLPSIVEPRIVEKRLRKYNEFEQSWPGKGSQQCQERNRRVQRYVQQVRFSTSVCKNRCLISTRSKTRETRSSCHEICVYLLTCLVHCADFADIVCTNARHEFTKRCLLYEFVNLFTCSFRRRKRGQ